MMKKFLPLLSAIALALPGMASAGTTSIMFDADGAGGLYMPTAVDLLDFKPGNALSVGGGGISNGSTVQLLYQANLGTTGLDGNTQTVSCFLGASCLTAVAGLQETASVGFVGSSAAATFTLAGPVGPLPSATNFFYIYAQNSTQGSNLAGNNFAMAPGATLILSGYVSQLLSSNFSTDGSQQLFDQKSPDN